MKKNYSLKFVNLHTNGEEASIYARIIMERKKTEFSTGISGPAKDWDAGSHLFAERSNYNANLNRQLEAAADRIEDIYKNMMSRGLHPTAGKIKSAFRGTKDVREQPELLDYIEDHIARLKKKVGNGYSASTISHYENMRDRLTEFLKSINESRILMEDFKRRHVLELKEYLLTTDSEVLKKPITLATCNRYLSKLRAVLNDALAREVINYSSTNKIRLERIQSEREFLTMDEVKAIEELDLSNNATLDRSRKLFLFSVYTGLRYCDAKSLSKNSIKKERDGRYRMTLLQQKTRGKIDNPMIEKAVAIYLHFHQCDPESELALPMPSNPTINKKLKDIAKLAGIHKNLIYHMGRHTCGTLLYESTGDLKAVSHFLGHKDINTTQIYAKMTQGRMAGVVKLFNKSLKN